jgi:hypothetical protein
LVSRGFGSLSEALERGFGLVFELIDLPAQRCQGNGVWVGGWVRVLGEGRAVQFGSYGSEFSKYDVRGSGLGGEELPQRGHAFVEENVMYARGYVVGDGWVVLVVLYESDGCVRYLPERFKDT